MNKHFAILTFAVFMVFYACGGDNINDPTEHIDEIPHAWGEATCEERYKVKASQICGFTNSGGYLWTGLERNDSLYKYSKGIYIAPGQFQQEIVWISLNNMEIPEGTYCLYAYISPDSLSIGDMKFRDLTSGPYLIDLYYAEFLQGGCIEGILGDSIFLIVNENFGEYSIEMAPYQSDYQGYSWQVFFNGGSIDNNWLKNLDNNGLLFPLKVSDPDNDLGWTVRATNQYPPYNVAETEVVIHKPHSLGSIYTQYDTVISYWSSQYAVPPQIVKGIIDQETDFDNYKFRYEMFFDHNTFQPNMYNKNYYELYHLADSSRTGSPYGFDRYGNSVPQGDSVATLDYDPYDALRNWSLSPPVIVVDTVRDSLITAYELAQLNSRFTEPANNFVSQIITCSSYGIMQPLHVSLIDYAAFGARNPQVLFDDASTAIYWGVRYFAYIYYERTNPNYDWDSRWMAAIGKYNGGPSAQEYYGVFTRPEINVYVNSVLNYADTYQPQSEY